MISLKNEHLEAFNRRNKRREKSSRFVRQTYKICDCWKSQDTVMFMAENLEPD